MYYASNNRKYVLYLLIKVNPLFKELGKCKYLNVSIFTFLVFLSLQSLRAVQYFSLKGEKRLLARRLTG